MSQILPWLPMLGGLMILSAFCSASEAAYFSLNSEQLHSMKDGSLSERRAALLMEASDRLLSTLLFSNLIANMLFFGIISVVTLEIQKTNAGLAGALSVGALLGMIVLCELVPKALAVMLPKTIACFAAFPLSGIQYACTPILPILGLGKDLSLRLFLPRFNSEPLLDLQDLENAVSISEGKFSSPQEKELLYSLLSLSEVTAKEIMRPRMHLPVFEEPVTLEDLRTADRSLGWIFIQEKEGSDAIDRALPMSRLPEVPPTKLQSLEKYAEETIYVLWNQTAAKILETLRWQNRTIAVVIDEHGATPGVIFLSDILETVFAPHSERVFQLTHQKPIQQLEENLWQVSGLYSVRVFCRHFQIPFPDNLESATLGGLLAKELQHLPEIQDEMVWNGFHFRVVKADEPALLVLEVSKQSENGDEE